MNVHTIPILMEDGCCVNSINDIPSHTSQSAAPSAATAPAASTTTSSSFYSIEPNGARIEERTSVERNVNLNEEFVAALDQLDARVERYRKDAMALQEQRDYLFTTIDLIKSNDLINTMTEDEREEISAYLHRVSGRLSTVELSVRTVRDKSQEDSLSKINYFINLMLKMGDPVLSRQRCQEYLNACCSTSEPSADYGGHNWEVERDIGPVDKRFESVLLGCTLDDQKNIKKRLHALLSYLNKQTIHQ